MENKDYEFKGTVTISTQEYRDLLHAVYKSENEADRQRDNYWSERSKVSKLEKENAEIIKANVKLNEAKEFIMTNEDVKIQFKKYLAGKQVIELDEEVDDE